MVLKIYADDMSANILDSIDPKMLARIQALRLMDDDFMTVVFSGDNKATEFFAENFARTRRLAGQILNDTK